MAETTTPGYEVSGHSGPGTHFVAVTPSDSTVYSPKPRALYIGGGGVIVLADDAGNTCSFTVLTGTQLDVRPARVMATGTTATLIVALY